MGEAAGAVSAYLGLGSNVGDRRGHLAHALRRLTAAGEITGLSSVYETEPVGFRDQPPFLNLVVRLETGLAPDALLAEALTIERERGRERTFRDAPRTLDIDLLLHGDHRVRAQALTLPHPRMTVRPFVLVPLLEVEPDLMEPGTGRRYAEYLPARVVGVRRVSAGEELLGTERTAWED